MKDVAKRKLARCWGAPPVGYDEWMCNIKLKVEWRLADGCFELDFLHKNRCDRCISCRVIYTDRTKEVTDILFRDGMVASEQERYGGLYIRKYAKEQLNY